MSCGENKDDNQEELLKWYWQVVWYIADIYVCTISSLIFVKSRIVLVIPNILVNAPNGSLFPIQSQQELLEDEDSESEKPAVMRSHPAGSGRGEPPDDMLAGSSKPASNFGPSSLSESLAV